MTLWQRSFHLPTTRQQGNTKALTALKITEESGRSIGNQRYHFITEAKQPLGIMNTQLLGPLIRETGKGFVVVIKKLAEKSSTQN